MRPVFRPQIEMDGLGPRILRIFYYSTDPAKQEKLRNLCKLTDNGGEPLEISLLWFIPASINIRLHEVCSDDQPDADLLCPTYLDAHR